MYSIKYQNSLSIHFNLISPWLRDNRIDKLIWVYENLDPIEDEQEQQQDWDILDPAPLDQEPETRRVRIHFPWVGDRGREYKWLASSPTGTPYGVGSM